MVAGSHCAQHKRTKQPSLQKVLPALIVFLDVLKTLTGCPPAWNNWAPTEQLFMKYYVQRLFVKFYTSSGFS
jgi:hypothetical protein